MVHSLHMVQGNIDLIVYSEFACLNNPHFSNLICFVDITWLIIISNLIVSEGVTFLLLLLNHTDFD